MSIPQAIVNIQTRPNLPTNPDSGRGTFVAHQSPVPAVHLYPTGEIPCLLLSFRGEKWAGAHLPHPFYPMVKTLRATSPLPSASNASLTCSRG